ncbi:hypothetical protein [Zobellia alginiliquefaciens]|uniref:hypothetical protein n=1 Tax=Zobellia alginiliquefaciens TaxID=3032586 RepID=UPI0023E44BF3|nr:hypothetical protein [Zobellia alginiliquefaciens]
MSFLEFFKRYNEIQCSCQLLLVSIKPQHFLQLGGGIKMPTGKYDKKNNEGIVNPSFQLGNGSWDYVLAINYGFTYKNWGISWSIIPLKLQTLKIINLATS